MKGLDRWLELPYLEEGDRAAEYERAEEKLCAELAAKGLPCGEDDVTQEMVEDWMRARAEYYADCEDARWEMMREDEDLYAGPA